MEKMSFYIAKAMRRFLKPAAKRSSVIDKTSIVCAGSQINTTTLGRYSYLGYDCFTLNADIGSFCSIADNCRIGGSSHSMGAVAMSPVFYEGKNILKKNFAYHKEAEVPKTIIGNDVWLGAGVQVKSGVKIGDGSVIGMGSIVTHDVPPYEIWAGNPAKCIRKRFPKEKSEALLQLKWWEWSEEELCRNAGKFSSVDELLKSFKMEREE